MNLLTIPLAYHYHRRKSSKLVPGRLFFAPHPGSRSARRCGHAYSVHYLPGPGPRGIQGHAIPPCLAHPALTPYHYTIPSSVAKNVN
jgi:hypothetical protein